MPNVQNGTVSRRPDKYRAWVGTWYPPDQSEGDNNVISAFDPATVLASGAVKYFVGQFEICPETSRLHLQFYVYMRNNSRLSAVKAAVRLPGCHLEVRGGTHEEARNYCQKPESRHPVSPLYEVGQPPRGQGTRTDLEALRNKIRDTNGDLRAIAEWNFSAFCRNLKGITTYASLCVEPRDPAETQVVHYLWGESGSGKTRHVFSQQEADKIYPVPLADSGTVWFDGFRPGYHTVILLDDFFHNFSVNFFLRFTDRYPMYLPVKGAFVPMPKGVVIYITSNYDWKDQYPDYVDQNAIRRRFHTVQHFNLPITS